MTADWAAIAARNNAHWCDLVCGGGEWREGLWSSATRTPPLYPDAVTLDRETNEADVLGMIDVGPGCSVKDSFSTLDLTAHGFRVLFDAHWIRARDTTGETSLPWSVVIDRDELLRWVTVAGVPVGDGLLTHPEVTILAGYHGDDLCAGGILNDHAGVVGMSNVFNTMPTARGESWHACVRHARTNFSSKDVVGYEREPVDGFDAIGPLRVWLFQ